MPLKTSTLRRLAHRRDAADEAVDDLLLARLGDGEVDADGAPASMPKSAAWATWRCTAAVSRNALAGMQPRLRQVPPSASISTMATLRPAEPRRARRRTRRGHRRSPRDRTARPSGSPHSVAARAPTLDDVAAPSWRFTVARGPAHAVVRPVGRSATPTSSQRTCSSPRLVERARGSSRRRRRAERQRARLDMRPVVAPQWLPAVGVAARAARRATTRRNPSVPSGSSTPPSSTSTSDAARPAR